MRFMLYYIHDFHIHFVYITDLFIYSLFNLFDPFLFIPHLVLYAYIILSQFHKVGDLHHFPKNAHMLGKSVLTSFYK